MPSLEQTPKQSTEKIDEVDGKAEIPNIENLSNEKPLENGLELIQNNEQKALIEQEVHEESTA